MTTPTFISLQGSYQHLQIALFNSTSCIGLLECHGKKASSELIPLLDKLLKKHKAKLSDINFIALDQGPGAFTSLRVIITTANAISFATDIPLIGIDGIDALAYETLATNQNVECILVLLNAFNNDVFHGFYSVTANNNLELVMPKGYENIDSLLEMIKKKVGKKSISCVGNGIKLFEDKINFENRSTPSPFHDVASAKQIGILALEKWKNQEGLSKYLLPLYLKSQTFKPKYSKN